MNQILYALEGYDGQFWKGMFVGAVAALLLTNDTVKTTMTDTFSSVWGLFQTGGGNGAGQPEMDSAEATSDETTASQDDDSL